MGAQIAAPARAGDLAGDEADAADVEVAVLLGEPQFTGQVLADQIAV